MWQPNHKSSKLKLQLIARDIMQSVKPGTMVERMVGRIAKTIMIKITP